MSSGIGGKVRENKPFQLSVGLFEARVLAINPNMEELAELVPYEVTKEPIYLKEDEKEGFQRNDVTVYLEDIKSKQVFTLKIFLKDTERLNRDKTKNQYINNVGVTAWADEPENLPEWFLKDGREYRKAFVGEEEMYTFLRSWLNQLDTRDADATLDLDWKKLMKGNVKELRDGIGSPYEGTLVALATVRTDTDKEGNPVEYQQVYNRSFLPGYTMKFFNLGSKKPPKFVEKFVANVTDPQNGCKEFYGATLTTIHPYDANENIAASTTTVAADDASY